MKKSIKFFSLGLAFLFAATGHADLLTPPMKLCPQQKTQWCWAGSAQAILTFYGKEAAQEDCAQVITTENKPQPLSVIAKIINKFYPEAQAKTNNNMKLTESEAKKYADNLAPFAMFWPRHFVVYAGYEGDIHRVMNPWPPNKGAWHSLTFDAVLNANGKGSWSGLTTTKGKKGNPDPCLEDMPE